MLYGLHHIPWKQLRNSAQVTFDNLYKKYSNSLGRSANTGVKYSNQY